MEGFNIRCRAVILHEGKLLVVRHRQTDDYVALPGGHLDQGEDLRECMKRELIEELGVEPEIGRLLYVNTFIQMNGQQTFDFFFEILNSSDFLGFAESERSHAHEIIEWKWTSPTDDLNILPKKFALDFKNGSLPEGEVRFIKD